MKIWISHDCDILDMTFFYPNWQLFNECVYSLFRLLVFNLTQYPPLCHPVAPQILSLQLTTAHLVCQNSTSEWLQLLLPLGLQTLFFFIFFHLRLHVPLQKRPLLTEGNHTLNNYNIDRYFEINTIILFSYYLKLRKEPYLTVVQFFNFLKYNIGRILIRL